jgi:HlyD family secretion protein
MKHLFNQFFSKHRLFKRNNLEPSQDRLEDGRGEMRAGLYALVIFLGGLIAWGSFIQLDAAIAADGVVTVSGNRQAVQHKEGGTIAGINVRDGQSVRRRDILIELNAPEVRAQEQALFGQSIHLQLQRALLFAEETGARTLDEPKDWALLANDDRAAAKAALKQYQKGIRSGVLTEYGARIASDQQQLAAVERQISLLRLELETMQNLAAEQLAPLTRVRALERALAALQGSHADLKGQIAMARQERTQSLRRIEGQIAEILPQLTAARARLEATRLRAPIDGVVVGLTANTIGGVIAPGERIMDIVPDNPELILEARIRPEDADDVAPKQRAEVRITAFGGHNIPIVYGAVRQISADRFEDKVRGADYFKVEVTVSQEELQRLSKKAGRRLRAGLPAQIIIPTQKRTAAAFLLGPLEQTLWGAFREE